MKKLFYLLLILLIGEQAVAADYTISTSGNNLVITDVTGTGETLDISQSGSNIRFSVSGKTFSLNNGAATNFPAEVALSGLQSITINAEGGDDIINVGAFITQLPSLTINGGTGDDEVNMNGDITFVANANLDLDLQNDDANPGVDVIILNTDANLRFSGTGAITLKSSKNIETKSGSSLAAVGGNILIEANQQTTPTVGSFAGIDHRGTISILNGSGGTGTVTLKGKGGNGTDVPQVGVLIAGNVTGLAGSLTIEGTGGISPANGNVGIHINAPISSKSLITLIGTGNGLGASADNAGVLINNTITNIPNTIKGIVITGTGANTTGTGNHGISSNSDFTNTNGAITLTGTAGNTASDDLFINSGTFSSSTNPNSNISLVGNKVTIGSAATIGTNLASFVNLLPRTDNTPINLGTETAGSLSYTSDEMNRIFANELYIGSVTTGPITISAPIAPANISATCRITLQTSSDLTISGGGITTLGGNVRFRATNIYPTFSGMDVSMGTTGVLSNGTSNTYVFDINGPAANTGYTQLQVAGKLSLLQTRLTITGSYTPTLGETFMIINNTGTDPIDHVFIGYAEEQVFNNFLGSELSAKITYVGGDGNDVVLTVVARPIFTDSPDNQTICSGNSATFTVASSNAASYKWQVRSNSVSTWGNLTNVSPYSNVNTSTLSISDVTGLNNYEYRCVATNEVGNTSSTPATLIVTPLPNATISYLGSSFAQNVAPVSVNRTGTAGGGYTASPAGLTIDDQTGQITPSSSLINNYVVTYTIAASGGCTQFTTTTSVEIVAAPAPDYTITTTDGHWIITDVAGNGDGLEVTENGTNIHIENYTFGRTFSLNGGPVAVFPVDIPLGGITDITINAGNGDDYIFISDFTQLLPSLTVNGDAGNDIVVLGNVHFMPDAHLNVDLQNDLGGAGEDEISINALVVLSGSGTAVLKASAAVYLANLTTENGDIVIEVNQQAVPLAAATGFLMQDNTVQITGTGALIVKATRGQADGPAIQTFGSSVLSTNSGNLTIEGYAGTGTGSGNKGIDSKARFSSVNGNIFIKGTGGGSGSSTDNQGIFLNNIAGGIKTTGSGSITLIGTGGNSTGSDNEGIHINSPFIESAAGDVSLTGYSNANSTPVALNNTPVRTLSAGKTIQINADDISYAGTISTTGVNSSVTLKPTTAGRAVTLGTNVPNTMNLSSAELGAISTYRLNIGDANTGAITNNAAQTLSAISNSVALTTGGALNFVASSFGIGSANLLINAAGGINPTAAGTDATVGTVSFATGNDLAISINGTTADTDYRQLNVAGSVNLSGLDLVLSGSHVPVLGQTFVIINNDGSDAIQGTFNGLPEGATIPSFLGSQLTARISYLGGDGNDVSITLEVFTATISGTRVVCQNTPFPQITFTATGGTIPYTFTYKINGGANQTITTVSGNSVSISQTTAMMGVFTYTLVSVRDGSSTQSNQIQTSTATITVHASAELSYTGANPACQWYTSKLWANTPGTWTANDPTKATIAEDGTVSALLAGQATFTFTVSATGCQTISSPLTIKPTPVSALIASKNDVCPNEVVSLDARCSIPTSTVNWNPGGPTVTPAAATLPYVYKASCTADGCTGNESSVEVRTHRILVDMKDLDVGALPLPIVRSVKDNMSPTNLIQAPVFPRRWTFIANGCDASESAEFKLSGPVLFNAIDNTSTYAMFANEGNSFYSIDHFNYGNGGSFPDGTYSLTVNLYSKNGAGGPFPKNRVPAGMLLATRTLDFTVGSQQSIVVGPSHGGRQAVVGNEQWVVDSGQWVVVAQNPVNEEVVVRVLGKVGEEVELALVNLQGQTIQHRGLKLTSSEQNEVLNVRHAPTGLYILKAIKGDKVKTIKVVKVD